MPKWTVEQSSAINETGKNIIVSAGAGSGKTAVLSERVLTHLKNKISITDLLYFPINIICYHLKCSF